LPVPYEQGFALAGRESKQEIPIELV